MKNYQYHSHDDLTPRTVQAIQWTGGNLDEIKNFLGDYAEMFELQNNEYFTNALYIMGNAHVPNLHLSVGDWIIRYSEMRCTSCGDERFHSWYVEDDK